MKRTFKISILFCLIVVLTFVFSACNKTDDDHAWSEWIVIKEAKCEEKGLLQRYCTECNYTESKPIDELGHAEIIDMAVPPTCTETGLTEGKHCDLCNNILIKQEIVPAIGGTHNYENEGVLIAPPTANGNGITKYTCSVCNHFYTAADYVPTDFIITADNRALVGYTGDADENLVIPACFQNNEIWYRVTIIDDSAFADCSNLASITIPDSVTTLGNYTFDLCTNLSKVTLGASLQDVGNCAFRSCRNLMDITIPNSVINIGDQAFNSCASLTSITIPDSVTSIGDGAFVSCRSLASIIVLEGNTVYKSKGNCLIEKSTKTLIAGCMNSVIPTDGSVTNIDDYAFRACQKLTSIHIPDSVTSIGRRAFWSCSSLANITVSNGNIAYEAKGNCLIEKSTKTLIAGCMDSVIPTDGSVTSIGETAFVSCFALESIIIPNSITNIGWGAFFGCRYLTSVTIPNSVTTINRQAFDDCMRLTSIIFEGTVAQWEAIVFGSPWHENVPATEVICSDGTVKLK